MLSVLQTFLNVCQYNFFFAKSEAEQSRAYVILVTLFVFVVIGFHAL